MLKNQSQLSTERSIVAIIVVVVIQFFLNKFITFKQHTKSIEPYGNRNEQNPGKGE